MVDVPEVLRAMPSLRSLPVEELEQLPWERVERKAGETFFEQGGPGDAAYGIITGRVRIIKTALNGKRVCLEVLGPGDLMALAPVVRTLNMPATAVAVEDTACMRVAAPAFRVLMQKYPDLSMKMLEVVSRRLLDAGTSRLELATEDVEVRLARTLLRLAKKFGSARGDEIIFSQSLTRQNLADLAGTTVESTIRVMSRWTKDGVVKSTASRITIAQPDELKRIAGVPTTQ